MDRRRVLWMTLLGGLLAGPGCTGATPTAPAGVPVQAVPSTGSSYLMADGTMMTAPAIYRWEIDPETLVATSDLVSVSRTAQDNDSRFTLPLNNFLQPRHLTIDSIRRAGEFLELRYTFLHPFETSSVSNRADLSFSGYLMFLADVPSATNNTYFGDGLGTVVANTSLVRNADAYWSPGGLLQLPGYTANTFPYILIADDGRMVSRFNAADHTNISNAGNPQGNFDPAVGWQVADTVFWTGFDVLHQGQGVKGVLQLDLASLAAGSVLSLDVAVIARYMDPKSATPGVTHRLPAAPPDVLNEFGYRYPHGALDVSKVTFLGQTTPLKAGVFSTTSFRFHVRDWDYAAETTTTPLADEPIVSKVPEVEVGSIVVSWSCPALEGPGHADFLTAVPTDDDTAYGGDAGPDSGIAGDHLFYVTDISRTGRPADTRGVKTAMVRIVDPNAAEAGTIPLDANLVPLTLDAPKAVTYQVMPVSVDGPQGSGWANVIRGSNTENVRGMAVDATGRVWVAGVYFDSIDLGGGSRPGFGGLDCFLAQYGADGSYRWDQTWGSTDWDNIGGIALRPDGLTAMVVGDFSAEMTAFGTTYVPEGSDIFLFQIDADGTPAQLTTGGSTGIDTAASVSSSGADNGFFVGGLASAPITIAPVTVPANPYDGYIVKVNQFNSGVWGTRIDTSGISVEPVKMVTLPSGSPVAAGYYLGPTDFGGGVRTASGGSDIFVARYDGTTGAHVWDRTFGGRLGDTVASLAVGFGGVLAVGGRCTDDIDFGTGQLSLPDDSYHGFVLSLTAGGAYRWSQVMQHIAGLSEISGLAWIPGSGGDLLAGGQTSFNTAFAGINMNATTTQGFYLRMDDATGLALWHELLVSPNVNKVQALTGGPDDTFAYALEFNGTIDVRPGPQVATITAPNDIADVGIVKLYNDNSW